MFSLSTLATSLAPLPPTPMPATLRRLVAPSTLRRATKGKASAALTTAVRFTNWRRVREWGFIKGVDELTPSFIPGSAGRSRFAVEVRLSIPIDYSRERIILEPVEQAMVRRDRHGRAAPRRVGDRRFEEVAWRQKLWFSSRNQRKVHYASKQTVRFIDDSVARRRFHSCRSCRRKIGGRSHRHQRRRFDHPPDQPRDVCDGLERQNHLCRSGRRRAAVRRVAQAGLDSGHRYSRRPSQRRDTSSRGRTSDDDCWS